jgi:hypothetical protein
LQWTLKAKTITIDNITLPVIASTICKNGNAFHMQKAKYSSAKEPISTQYANRHATRMLGTIEKADLQSIVKDKCKHLTANCQRSYCKQLINELPLDGTLDGWKN